MRHFLQICVLLLPVLSSVSAWSQSAFARGYIIKENNDTIYGLMNRKSYIANSRQCSFKKSAGDSVELFKPDEIKAYRYFSGQYYISKKILLDGDSAQVFLEFLVDGIADLYYLKEWGIEHYYLEKADKGITELSQENRTVYKNLQEFTSTYDKYKGILKYVFEDDKSLYRKIDQTPLNVRSMVSLTKDYHNDVCNDYSCIDYSRNLHSVLSYGMMGSILFARLGLKDSKGFTWSVNPAYGIIFQINPTFWSDNWSFSASIMNAFMHFKGIFDKGMPNGTYTLHYDIDYKYISLMVPLKVNYTIPRNNMRIRFDLGLDNIFLPEKTLNVDWYYYENLKYSEEEHPPAYEIGYSAGAGLLYDLNKKWTLQTSLDYELQTTQHLNKWHTDLMNQQVIHNVMFSFGAIIKVGN